ncbi:hypothetical protein Athai_28920 [Actinocatenispora thailandica]|uniref:Thiol reductant ABC exporter subunit CydC n=1 Tax=Actinocatenispora thailandica TaxID=227318 RepID=A0A7R7HXR4_9ACTN|nr:hypothetical protein Athai_28920 [Actinocatenispora thailandica]
MLRAGGTGRGRLLLAGAAGVGASGAAVGLGATAAWLIARAAQHPPVLYLLVAIVAVRAFGLSRGVLRYAERLASHDAALRVLARLRVGVYRRLAALSPAGLTTDRSGDLTARLVGDIDGLADVWLRLLLPYTVAGLVGAGSVALVATLLPGAGAALAATLLIVAVAAPVVATGHSRRAQARIAPLRGALSAGVVETIEAADELTAHGAAGTALTRLDELDAALTRAEARSAAGHGIGAAIATAAGGAAVWAGLALGAPAVAGGTLTGVLAVVVVLTPLAVHEAYAALPVAAAQLPRLRGAARRVYAVVDRADPVAEPEHPAADPTGPYDLLLRDVHAGWPGGPDVLRGLDLRVPAGAHIAITGASGSGKSTLAAVLLRFLDARGELRLAGTALADLPGDTVRRHIGLCAQDVHLFDTSIAENLRIARPDASPDTLHGALAAARLDRFVDSLPDGLDTFTGEHGRQLSGGQQQRLALARALLADVDILICDEATEHLDEAAAGALTRHLLAAAAGRTVVLLTHRRADLHLFDAVYELVDGRLRPDGVSASRQPQPDRTFVV